MLAMMRILLLTLFLICDSGATITDSDKASIDTKLSTLSTTLSKSYTSLTSKVSHSTDFSHCNFYTACPDPSHVWPGSTYPPVNLVSVAEYGSTKVNFNNTVTKILYGTTPSQNIINEICMVESSKGVWIDNLKGFSFNSSNPSNASGSSSNSSGVTWQYYGGETGVTVFSPAFKWSDDDVCATSRDTDYDPRKRPWYVSATSAQKNLIIVIDLSDTLKDPSGSRLSRMKSTVLLLLDGLSYRDFVGVVTYTEFGREFYPQMTRATSDNINAVKLYINSLQTKSDSKSNIGDALNDAYTMLKTSIATDLTSKCQNIFFVLSSGSNDMPATKPIDVVKQNNADLKVTVFSTIYSSDTSAGGKLDLAEVSCYTQGNLVTVSTDNEAVDAVASFNKFTASTTHNDVVKWSQPYEDAITFAKMITGSVPIYKTNSDGSTSVYGVTAIDVDLSSIYAINPNITEQDLFSYLASYQACSPQIVTTDLLKTIQTEDTCKQNSKNSADKPGVVKHKGGIVFATVMMVLILMACPWLIVIKSDSRSGGYAGVACIGTFCMFVLGLWALCVLWIHLYSEIIEHEMWVKTTLVTERMEDNPYRCCDVVNCRSCEEFYGTSCNSLQNSLQEGPCGNGYHCCHETCYTCNCHTSCTTSGKTQSCSTHCSTCCRCDSSVDHRRCDVACGTCWNAVVTKSYKDNSGELHYGYVTLRCSRNDRSCVDKFFASEGPVGKQTPGYYNPYNMNEIKSDVSYNDGVLAAFLIPAILMALGFLAIMVVLCVQWGPDIVRKCSDMTSGRTIMPSDFETPKNDEMSTYNV